MRHRKVAQKAHRPTISRFPPQKCTGLGAEYQVRIWKIVRCISAVTEYHISLSVVAEGQINAMSRPANGLNNKPAI